MLRLTPAHHNARTHSWKILFGLCCLCLSMLVSAQEADDESSWVEETLNPSTEWLEQLVAPASRWLERQIQEPDQSPPVIREAPREADLPEGVIAPAEAARLLTSLYPGDVLSIRLMDTTTLCYSIKLLHDSGTISTFYLHAETGILLDEAPLFNHPQDSKQPQDNSHGVSE
ncbi:PepSY domain-containing protein [Bacterioplanoides sp.]|uniref:PepSY domain-containing protein n=1 Tax=Bacterioplanoides sp. TaxID=2066072 RepID=UPI003B00D0D0